jgi:hypothetical protein
MLQQRRLSSDIVSDHRLRRAFDEAILYRITLRRWYREHRLTYNWPDLEHENTAILRAMLAHPPGCEAPASPANRPLDRDRASGSVGQVTIVTRPDLSARTALSKSALTGFDLCQTKAWLSIHHPIPFVPNEKVTFGSAVDAAVEQLLVSARAGIPIERDRALAAATEVILRDNVEVSFDEIERAVDRFTTEIVPLFDWGFARLQPSITAQLPDLGETNGHPDIVLRDNRVLDVKTAGKAKDGEPSAELGLYALLVEEETGTPVPSVGYLTWVRLKKPYWQVTERPVDAEYRRWAYEQAAAFVRAKNADDRWNAGRSEPINVSMNGGPKFRGLCSDCQYNPANGGPCGLAYQAPVDEGERDVFAA